MAHNHDPQLQYPRYNAHGFVQQQYQQPPPSAYPSNRSNDPRIPTQRVPVPSQHAVDAYPLQRSHSVAPQQSRYSPLQTQVSQQPYGQHSPLTAQSSGFERHSPGTMFTDSQQPLQQAQYAPQPPPRSATAFQPARQAVAAPSVLPPTPISPVRSQGRRPLPQRPDGQGGATPTRRPLPDVNAATFTVPSLHRASHSVDAYSAASPPAPITPVSPGLNPGQSISPRPLPDPIPRSTRSLDLTRSSSPVKQLLDGHDLPPPGQKFVPLWKRALPSPAQQAQPSTMTGSFDARSAPPGHSTGYESPTRASTTQQPRSVRPLPPSPGASAGFTPPSKSAFARAPSNESPSTSPPKASSAFVFPERTRTLPNAPSPPQSSLTSPRNPMTASRFSPVANVLQAPVSDSPLSSDSEDLYDNALLRRPERTSSSANNTGAAYGIRDLPARVNAIPNSSPRPQGSPGAGPYDGLPGNGQAGAPLSMASRIAALTLTRPPQLIERSSQSAPGSPPKQSHPMSVMDRSAHSTGSTSRWPTNLPPLPRAPVSPQPDPQKAPSSPGRNGSAFQSGFQSPGGIPSPTRSQIAQAAARDASPTRPLPSTPQGASPRDPSPVRTFPSLRHPSPVRSQPALPLPSPAGEPSSPTRAQAPGPFAPRDAQRGRALPQAGGSYSRGAVPDLDDAPPPSLRRTPSPVRPAQVSPTTNLPTIRTHDVALLNQQRQLAATPRMRTPSSAASVFTLSSFPAPPEAQASWSSQRRSPDPPPPVPQISFSTSSSDGTSRDRRVSWEEGPTITIGVSGPDDGDSLPQISLPGDNDRTRTSHITVGNLTRGPTNVTTFDPKQYYQLRPVVEVDDYPPCLGCGALIIGDAVNAMGGRWHPRCYRCCVCNESLEMLAPIEHEGKLYCTLDYHEKFSPRCYHCHTVIADPSYITLNDKDLGVRTYHDQHFFCSECGDPFVTPNMKGRTFEGDGLFEGGEVGNGFTVFRGFPYCAKCHAKLRWPKCKKCKKSMAPDSDIIEALGAKWCSDCFVCTSCHSPFRNGRLFLRDNKPFCQDCFEIMIKSEF